MTVHMMEGNLFDSDAQVFVNAVNCDGIMGKGIALQFKQKYPRMFELYKESCDAHQLLPGGVFLWANPDLGVIPAYIFNVATKNHWRNQSKWQWIYSGISISMDLMRRMDLHTIAMPALGCGEGGLEWEDARKRISNGFSYYSRGHGIEIYLYAPLGKNPDVIEEGNY